ncbi:MAG: DUF2283 domain-containing protein [Elusimicrobia bacterium]|nr:DUF2283 domain-containing protein [Elusimicrobiota bacterium]
MYVNYDKEVDAAFIQLSEKKPASAVEIKEGVVLHLTKDGDIVAFEILKASKRLNISELFSYRVPSLAGV